MRLPYLRTPALVGAIAFSAVTVTAGDWFVRDPFPAARLAAFRVDPDPNLQRPWISGVAPRGQEDPNECACCLIDAVRVGGAPDDNFIGPVCNGADGNYRVCYYVTGEDLPNTVGAYRVQVDGVPYAIDFFDARSSTEVVICLASLPSPADDVDVQISLIGVCDRAIVDLYDAPRCLGGDCIIQELRVGGQPGDTYIGAVCNADGTYRICFYVTGQNLPSNTAAYAIEVDGVATPVAFAQLNPNQVVLCVTSLPEGMTDIDVRVTLAPECIAEALDLYDAPTDCTPPPCLIDGVRLGGQVGDVYIGPTCNGDGSYRTCFYVSGENLPTDATMYQLTLDGAPASIAGVFEQGGQIVVCATGLPSGRTGVDLALQLSPTCMAAIEDLFDAPTCPAVRGPSFDTSPPEIDTPAANLTVECDGAGNTGQLNAWLDSRGGAQASDACSNVSWSNDFGGLTDGCGATGAATVTFSAMDDCGLVASTTATFRIVDTIAPTLTIPPDVTIFCHDSADPNENPALGKATATDNCDPNVDISYVDDCQTRNCRGKIYRTWTATDDCGNATSGVQIINVVSRGTTGQKGSLLILPKVEQRYDNAGALTQDTFITISNDSSNTQHVKLFYVDGDTWESVDNGFVLTPEEPYYFSLEDPLANASGQTPRRFRDVLAGGAPQPDPLGRGGLTVRGFVLIFACDNTFNRPVRNNNLTAKVTIVNYADTEAYEYDATAFQAACVPHGAIIDRSELMLGGDYDYAPGQILADMFADNSEALGGNVLTELTLLVLDMDFRQNGRGPATTFAFFTVHKQDETPLTWQQDYCVTCWDSRLISSIEPSVFDGVIVNADRVKARIETFRNDGICGVESRQAPLLGVMTKAITFTGGPTAYAASEATGQLVEQATIIIGGAQSLPGGELRAAEDTPEFRAPGATRETLKP